MMLRMDPNSHTNNSVEIVRPLNAADLAMLDEPRGVVTPPLKKIRDSHHQLARLIARGFSSRDMSVITGYSVSRISILKNDPTFSELISFYRTRNDLITEEFDRDHMRDLANFHQDLVEEARDRINETPELVSNDTLTDWMKFTADRIGLGPTSKSQNLNLNLDLAGRVAAGRQRADRLSAAPAAKQTPPTAPLPLAGPEPERKP